MNDAHAANREDPVVVAVVVTYNRLPLLRECLAALSAQSRPVDSVLVVDNASTDGTSDAVRAEFPHVRLLRLVRNTGGAGGFAAGLADAVAEPGSGSAVSGGAADFVWLLDDDTIPEPDALAALLDAEQRYRGWPPAVLASQVRWTDGRAHPMNTPRVRPLASAAQKRAAALVGAVPIRTASFVSVLVRADTCRARGLPIADYFLWNDDFEFTARLLRHHVGLLCAASVVVHKTRTFGSTDVDPGERFFYEVRNKVWTLTRSAALGPLERTLYTGSTVLRWARTIRASGDRRLLLRHLWAGLAAGLRAGPRPTSVVLADALAGFP